MAVRHRASTLGALAIVLAARGARAEDVRVSFASVEDTRASDARMGGMAIELKVEGAGAADVKALRVKVKSAKDDTGTSLWKPDKDAKPADFEEFSVDRQPKPKLRLQSPSRGASRVDVAGEVELFVPKRDPGTSQRFEKYLAKLDKPIAGAALKSAKVEITPLSAAEFTKRAAKNKPSREEIVAEGKKRGASDKEIEEMVKMVEALSALGGGDAPDEKSVVFEVKDPDARMLGIDLVGQDGQTIGATMRSSSGGRDGKLLTLSYSDKPPADATLLVTLRTPKSVVTVPLDMKGVPLP